MDKRVTWGILIIFMSLFYIFQQHIPENILKYVFNYQMILMIIGIFFVFNKSKFGWAVVAIGLYLYLKEFFGDYFDTNSLGGESHRGFFCVSPMQ